MNGSFNKFRVGSQQAHNFKVHFKIFNFLLGTAYGGKGTDLFRLLKPKLQELVRTIGSAREENGESGELSRGLGEWIQKDTCIRERI